MAGEGVRNRGMGTAALCCRRLLLAGAAAAVATGTGRARAADAPWLVYCADDFPPYCWADAVRGAVGMDVDIIRALLDRLDVPYLIEPMAWSRAMAGLEQGRCDMLFGLLPTPERRREFCMVGSFRDGEIAFAVRDDSRLTYDRLEDLAGLTIGTALRNSYEPAFDKAAYFRRDPARTDELSLLKLVAGRVDMVVGDRFALEWKARQVGIADKVRLLPKPLTISPHYVGLPFDRTDKANRLQVALDAVLADGGIDAIIQRWRATG